MKKEEDAIRQVLARAFDLHRMGLLGEAERLCRQVLQGMPRHAQAQHLLGMLLGQQGRLREALELLMSVVKASPGSAAALSNLGLVLHELDRHEEALASFDEALRIDPRNATALSNRGNAQAKLGRSQEALAIYDCALAIRPDYPEALYNRGQTLLVLGRFEEALASYQRALRLRPGQGDVLHGRASALCGLGRYEEALASFDAALTANPVSAEAHYRRANTLVALRRYKEAVQGYDTALFIRPDDADALTNRGNALVELRRYDEALVNFERTLAIRPFDASTLNNRGAVLKSLQRDAEALATYEQALGIDPQFADALYNRANLLKKMKRYEEALLAYDRARTVAPSHDGALDVLPALQTVCDFARIDSLKDELVSAIKAGKPFASLPLLALCDDPALHLVCARGYANERLRPPSEKGPAGETKGLSPIARRSAGKLRVAYFSGDFYQHPVALLAVELFEIHDRTRFDVIGISFGPDDRSETRRRLSDAFDEFHEVRANKDHEIAELIRNCGTHIAIDLTGYTEYSRSQVLSLRPAPVQVNYLGYPGTMGAHCIDYVIADRITLPFDQQPFYTEKIVHLPDCYQVNDRKRPVPDTIGPEPVERSAAGLPEHGFVFCCFNNSHKITRPVFEIWMRLLNSVPRSVLWLLGDNAAAERNLRREAQERGVEPERLVFAGRLNLEAHLARHRLAGLFLDTLPYNAHTTASDALWAGLPVVTCQGRAFAGRVAASLLHAVGLPELMTTSLADYEALALRLAGDPSLLASVRSRLANNRTTHALFDPERFRRHIEAAYTRMWEICERGEPPQSFSVEPW
jgi:predicted O-linked N-acetylglucosamine transferase (SPINDLY family)